MKNFKVFGVIISHLLFVLVPIILVLTKESQSASVSWTKKSQSASVSSQHKSQPASVSINKSQAASISPNKRTTNAVIHDILQNKEIFPSPKLSIGHFGGDDALPFSSDKLQDKPGNNYTDKISALLNSDPLSRREARLIIGALDRKTCFAKVLCGLGSQEPDKHTDLLNDYAYLMGEVLGTSQEEQDNPKKSNKNNKKTKNKLPQESILTDIWDEFSVAKESLDKDDDESDEEQDDATTSRERPDRFDLDEYRVLHGKVDHFPARHAVMPPFHPFRPPLPRRRIKIIRPKLYLGRVRIGRKLARQCRQLGGGDGHGEDSRKYKCPYDDAQMGTIVTKLRQTMRGENGGSVLNTVGQGALSGASQAMSLLRGAANTLKSSVTSPEKMNVVINLHQNMTMPGGGNQQMSGFAVTGPAFYGSSSPALPSSNESQILPHSEESHLGGGVRFNPFYIIPLGGNSPQSPPPPPIPTTTPAPFIPTTTLEPLQQLIGFLYSVGYANESTPEPDLDRPLTLADLAMLTNSKKPISHEHNDDESEEIFDNSRNKDKSIYADKEGIVRIKFSRRSGRFQREDEEEDQSTIKKQDRSGQPEEQWDNVPVPALIFRTFMRFVSYMGARVG